MNYLDFIRCGFASLAICFLYVIADSSNDPCKSYTAINDTRLMTSYKTQASKVTPMQYSGGTWYRYSALNNGVMSTSCPQPGQCATKNLAWMIDSLPGQSSGITKVALCLSNAGDCCSRRGSMDVKNCGKYVVYKLTPLPPFVSFCFNASAILPDTASMISASTSIPASSLSILPSLSPISTAISESTVSTQKLPSSADVISVKMISASPYQLVPSMPPKSLHSTVEWQTSATEVLSTTVLPSTAVGSTMICSNLPEDINMYKKQNRQLLASVGLLASLLGICIICIAVMCRKPIKTLFSRFRNNAVNGIPEDGGFPELTRNKITAPRRIFQSYMLGPQEALAP